MNYDFYSILQIMPIIYIIVHLEAGRIVKHINVYLRSTKRYMHLHGCYRCKAITCYHYKQSPLQFSTVLTETTTLPVCWFLSFFYRFVHFKVLIKTKIRSQIAEFLIFYVFNWTKQINKDNDSHKNNNIVFDFDRKRNGGQIAQDRPRFVVEHCRRISVLGWCNCLHKSRSGQ